MTTDKTVAKGRSRQPQAASDSYVDQLLYEHRIVCPQMVPQFGPIGDDSSTHSKEALREMKAKWASRASS